MARLKIFEAMKAYEDRTGQKMQYKDIAVEIFPNSSEQSRAINISRLATGKTKTVSIEAVNKICELTGVDANFLFGIT